MIDAEMRATIRRLHFNRHLTVNAVAEALGIHHDTVRRAIGTSRMEEVRAALSELEKYETTILDTLAIYPKISASRIYLYSKSKDMVVVCAASSDGPQSCDLGLLPAFSER
ncbi:MAG: hypothetical protein H7249_02445 [Chitinophagaceae bacterium]|nr:hypothetical protein [Oligoflexus sp.]